MIPTYRITAHRKGQTYTALIAKDTGASNYACLEIDPYNVPTRYTFEGRLYVKEWKFGNEDTAEKAINLAATWLNHRIPEITNGELYRQP